MKPNQQFVGQPQKPANTHVTVEAGDAGVVLMSGLLLAVIFWRTLRKAER